MCHVNAIVCAKNGPKFYIHFVERQCLAQFNFEYQKFHLERVIESCLLLTATFHYARMFHAGAQRP